MTSLALTFSSIFLSPYSNKTKDLNFRKFQGLPMMFNRGNLNKLKYYKTHQVNGPDISRSVSLLVGRTLEPKEQKSKDQG
jgi:hypothetical protein